MSRRKIEALRNLAERPGTEAEGQLAREMLAKIEAKRGNELEGNAWFYFERYLRTQSMDDLQMAVELRQCDCGERIGMGSKCGRGAVHEAIQSDIRKRFPKGARVYYNYWAYSENCPATVAGYCTKPELWGWIRLKFEHLKGVRAVPIYQQRWHLSTEPVDRKTIRRDRLDGRWWEVGDAV